MWAPVYLVFGGYEFVVRCTFDLHSLHVPQHLLQQFSPKITSILVSRVAWRSYSLPSHASCTAMAVVGVPSVTRAQMAYRLHVQIA